MPDIVIELSLVGVLIFGMFWKLVFKKMADSPATKVANVLKDKLCSIIACITLGKFCSKQGIKDVHVLLPLTGDAKGDGLIQAAGILKAATKYDKLNIKLHDTNNNIVKAKTFLDSLMTEYNDKGEPLCVIATMSETCIHLGKFVENELSKYTKLKRKFTIIFTVAAAADVPHNPKFNIYRYSISGLDEAIKIKGILTDPNENDFSLTQKTILASMGSNYPTGSIAELARKIMKHRVTQPFLVLPFDRRGNIVEYDQDLSVYEQAIVFGYDNNLLNMFEFLINNGFRGKVLCPTTFSVKDWQQLWLTKEQETQLDYYYLEIENIKHIELAYNFEQLTKEIIDNLNLTNNEHDLDGFRREFTDKEKESYESIDSNYISDLCFDTLRIIDASRNFNTLKFNEIKSSLNEQRPGPFGTLEEDNEKVIRPSSALRMKKLIR